MNDKMHGQGVMQDKSGGREYEGGWKDGMRHGKGIRFSGYGYVSYDGEWRNGREHGIGVITLNNGYKGKVRFENGQKVEGL